MLYNIKMKFAYITKEKYPQLHIEWSSENFKKLEEFTVSDKIKAKWICRVCGEQFIAKINNRIILDHNNDGCKKCKKKFKRTDKSNCIELTHPHLLDIWDFEKNIIKPSEISYNSNKKIWWKCKQNSLHSYQQKIYLCNNKERKCLCCSNNILSADNSFSAKFPNLIKFWSIKNNIKPEEILFNKSTKIWLKCSKNKKHKEFNIAINKINKLKNICPKCMIEEKKSQIKDELTKFDKPWLRYKGSKSRWIIYQISQKRSHLKNKEWKLTNIEAAKLITSPCFYCGRKFDSIGIDRVKNELGYFSSNCVSCCCYCNNAKSNLSLNNFIIWINRFVERQNKILLLSNKRISQIFGRCKRFAKDRNKEFNINSKEFKLLIEKPCYYCGDIPTGVDRKDNSIGYNYDNCCSCCSTCNKGKLTQTEFEFKEMIAGLIKNLEKIKQSSSILGEGNGSLNQDTKI